MAQYRTVAKQLVFILLCYLITDHLGAKILGIFPINIYSHFLLARKLMKELAARGHEVTVISPYPNKLPIDNYTDISIEEELDNNRDKDMFVFHKEELILMNKVSIEMGSYVTEHLFQHPKIKQLLTTNTTFDLVICQLFYNFAQMAFVHHFNTSLILFSVQSPYTWTKNILRHPQPFTYVPSVFSGLSHEMSTFQRIYNLFLYLRCDYAEYFVTIPRHNEYLRKYFPNTSTVEELFRKVDLVLYNSHVSVNPITSKFPNMIEIGGYHLEDSKPLPEDIQNFLDEAAHGAIYFSMGTNLKSINLKREFRLAFLAAFGQLKERVIWKWENDTIDGLPENVKIKKWLPQQDVLAHPNIKLFITHCGLSSMMEAINHGIPFLGIPIYVDQPTNCAVFKATGMGKTMRLDDITKETLTETLKELLSNPEYKTNAKFRSRIFRDQDMKPMDRAMFWIEHVLRHKGGKHLQAYGIHMPLYQYYMVDLVLIAFAVVISVISVSYFVFRKCKRFMICNKEKVKTL